MLCLYTYVYIPSCTALCGLSTPDSVHLPLFSLHLVFKFWLAQPSLPGSWSFSRASNVQHSSTPRSISTCGKCGRHVSKFVAHTFTAALRTLMLQPHFPFDNHHPTTPPGELTGRNFAVGAPCFLHLFAQLKIPFYSGRFMMLKVRSSKQPKLALPFSDR